MIVSLHALGQILQRAPVTPTSVAALLERHEEFFAFRAIVREVFPQAEAEIMAAWEEGASRETARCWAFLHKVEAELFPVYEVEEYEQVVYAIPFVPNGWSYDRLHDLEVPLGELLLFAFCAQPYADGGNTRVSLLDAVEAHVPRSLLLDIPSGGFSPAELHERLDGTPYAAAADFADWVWAETGSVFLDLTDEVEIVDATWSRENVQELAGQWREADAILARIGKLAMWLAADPPSNVARVLDALLGRDPHLEYQRQRRFYACEITPDGLVPIAEDEPDLTVPLGRPS